uniref:Secreted protein n=1 Tax=Mycena chlorophos TaxID=658473 RepID=A0ABQ0L558_MYCCL|nr:predicted protein [Mycena chlorophos]
MSNLTLMMAVCSRACTGSTSLYQHDHHQQLPTRRGPLAGARRGAFRQLESKSNTDISYIVPNLSISFARKSRQDFTVVPSAALKRIHLRALVSLPREVHGQFCQPAMSLAEVRDGRSSPSNRCTPRGLFSCRDLNLHSEPPRPPAAAFP